MKRLGLDLGTKHIVLAYRDEKGELKERCEINGYLILERADDFTEQLLVKQGVPFVKRDNELIAIGKKAEKLAYSFNKTLQRPMAHGGVSMTNDDALEIITIIIKAIIGKLNDDAILYYCTTADPINANINMDFHRKLVKQIIESYQGEAKINAFQINEARCLVIEESAAIGISWGAGTVTVHAGVMGVPAFEFSIVGSGDWVDIEVAKRFGYDPKTPHAPSTETPTSVCRRKESIDLLAVPDDNVGKTIVLFYEILIENVITQIIKGLKENKDKFRFDDPLPVINAGGTCMPKGFMELFKKKIDKVRDQLAIPIGEVKKAENPLYAVSHGCLKAAEFHKSDMK
jgi:hypothetical protein